MKNKITETKFKLTAAVASRSLRLPFPLWTTETKDFNGTNAYESKRWTIHFL